MAMAASAVRAGRPAAARAPRYASGVNAGGPEAAVVPEADGADSSPEAAFPDPPGVAVQAERVTEAASRATAPTGTVREKVRGVITRNTVSR
ncbi:hypothetical protein GCM10011574_55080 [Microbispora bryophytorum]|uniref:Uncharacterized protein n=1 Tax=Microbispora bryophytorum TaxID=1460882 RepID=A0A8H9H351_9ACTN|nr:hypothetical protein GCM10011574_55080 [Microbispora bryophytorum]